MKIRIIEGLFICTIYSLALKVAATMFERLAFLGDALLVAGWIFILAFVLLKSRGKILAFKTTGRLLSFLHLSNPDLFPSLNETALKKHISVKVDECPYSEIIKRITLYQGASGLSHYQLIIEAPEYHKGFSNLQRFWEGQVQHLFEEHFIEVYREKPKVIFPYQKGSFWSDWNATVVDIDLELPNTLVSKNHKWDLYYT